MVRSWWVVVVGLSWVLAAAACTAQSGTGEQGTEEQGTEETQPVLTTSRTNATAPVEPAGGQPFQVYVSLSGDQRVSVLELDAAGGLALLDQRSVELPGPAGSSVYGALSQRLFVRAGNGVATVDIGVDGALTLAGTADVGAEPVYLDLALGEQMLLAAYFGEGEVRAHSSPGVDPSSLPVGQVDASGVEPHAIVVDASGTWAYAPHRNGDAIVVYSVETAGVLKRVGDVASEAGAGPRHLVLSPSGSFAYVINEFADSVTVYQVDDVGMLAPLQTISTLPDGIDPDINTGADIHITPDGAFVYASNRGHDSIAMFAVGADGLLESLGQIPTQARPRDFGMSPDGRFIVVAGQDSGQVESYAIAETGLLTSLGAVTVGDGPVWVTIV